MQGARSKEEKPKAIILGAHGYPLSCIPTLDKNLAKKRTKDIAEKAIRFPKEGDTHTKTSQKNKETKKKK